MAVRGFKYMNKLLFILLAMPLMALGQTKTWVGTSSVIWPAQGTNSLQLSTGDVVAKINNVKTTGTASNYRLLQLQKGGTNRVEIDRFGAGYFGDGAYAINGNNSLPGIFASAVADNGFDTVVFNFGGYNTASSPSSYGEITGIASSSPDAVNLTISGSPGLGLAISPFTDGSVPFKFNATSALLTGNLFEYNWQGTNAVTADVYGALTALKYNKVTITPPATGSTLAIDDGFTLHATGNVTALSGSHTGTSSGTNTGDQTSVTGNAGTATALANARTINGTSFDGTANITVTAAAGTLTGATLASGVTASSLTSFGSAPALGAATATTQAAGTSSTQVATTAFVANSFVRTLDKNRTSSTVSNSVAETTLYTYTIPANLLGTSGGVHLQLVGSHIGNNGTSLPTVKIKFGGTLIYGDAPSSQTASSTPRAWMMTVDLFNNGTTSSQVGNLVYSIGASSAADAGAGTGALSSASLITSANLDAGTKDTTSNQDLVVTWTHGATGAVSTTVNFANLIFIP